ncbi:MAG: hypothetical protein ACI90M_003104, partial [Candidatus Azotimanducaceae bacterium]
RFKPQAAHSRSLWFEPGAVRRARYAGRDTQGDSTQGKHTLAKTSR